MLKTGGAILFCVQWSSPVSLFLLVSLEVSSVKYHTIELLLPGWPAADVICLGTGRKRHG